MERKNYKSQKECNQYQTVRERSDIQRKYDQGNEEEGGKETKKI